MGFFILWKIFFVLKEIQEYGIFWEKDFGKEFLFFERVIFNDII